MEELPRGPVRDFVEELHMLWRAARRPDLRTVEQGVADMDGKGAVSREQFRRMLWGKTVPATWANVEAVFLLLCERSGIDPDRDRWPDALGDFVSYRDEFERRWNDALDAPPAAHAVPVAKPPDPWGEEPPF